jgi:hypothetical protein
MFLVSEKITNPRVRKDLIAVYEVGESSEGYTIDFWGVEAEFLEMWQYDSEDERNRVIKNVDAAMGQPSGSGILTRAC